MSKRSIYGQLLEVLSIKEVLLDEPMCKHTSFKIGGTADYFIIPKNREHLNKALHILKGHDVPIYILGNGSNLLVSDKGFRGAIIQIYNNFNQFKIEEEHIYVEAGILLSKLANIASDYELEGLEFASGIPGTLGGAIYMNAGAYGGEMKDVIEEVEVYSDEDGIFNIKAKDLALDYRTSVLQRNHYIALSAKLKLKKGKRIDIKEKMKELNSRRKLKQPLEFPSAGSMFKRPDGFYAGKLIMDAGLKGFSIGGAKVSEKHCGFIINENNATCEDVIKLIDHVRKEVKEQFNVELEPEVRIIGNIT